MSEADISPWIIVGISGVTCSGKSTLASKLLTGLHNTVCYLAQDDYILPNDFPGHPAAPPPLKGISKESLQSIHVETMMRDIRKILNTSHHDIVLSDSWEESAETRNILRPDQKDDENTMKIPRTNGGALHSNALFKGRKQDASLSPVLIIEGFLIFNQPEIPELCNLKYFLTLNKEECWKRRQTRNFSIPGGNAKLYFDLCTWSQYEKHYKDVHQRVKDIVIYNGMTNPQEIYHNALKNITDLVENN
ncbi:unnamed protein product [Meganyctiphanes norvegica]|uniref:Uncharacterized protein n=1 Tax=Meganyctiphanes norvegica TaxID=48144 RepID=A0AAV2SSD5_MEGNR